MDTMVSNNQMGVRMALGSMRPLLNEENPHATLIGLFTTAMDEIMAIRNSFEETKEDEEAEMADDSANVRPCFGLADPSAPMYNEVSIIRWTASLLFKDYSDFFERYDCPGGIERRMMLTYTC